MRSPNKACNKQVSWGVEQLLWCTNLLDNAIKFTPEGGLITLEAAEEETRVLIRVKDNGMVGEVAKVSGNSVTLIIGNISSKMPLDRVERISSNEFKAAVKETFKPVLQKVDSSIQERKLNFKMELDVRGERLSDALDIVMHYIDDAIMLDIPSVRIIHGKGTGVLREEIQKYLRAIPGIASAKDEHIQQGGSGVTVVTFDR